MTGSNPDLDERHPHVEPKKRASLQVTLTNKLSCGFQFLKPVIVFVLFTLKTTMKNPNDLTYDEKERVRYKALLQEYKSYLSKVRMLIIAYSILVLYSHVMSTFFVKQIP